MSQILLVEDFIELADSLIALLSEKYSVTHAPDLKSAKLLLENNKFELLILDVSLPDGSGFDLYESYHKDKVKKLPVIFLTGHGDLTDRMKGLELGAQDYILKPFYTKELVARIEMRIKQFESVSDVISYGNLNLDKRLQRVAIVENNQVLPALNLTPNEYKILLLLVSHKGEVVSRTRIVSDVWGVGFSLSDKAVNSHISNLRKKIQGADCRVVASDKKGYSLVLSQRKDHLSTVRVV